MGNFDGKVILITGAAGGIGAATVRRLANDGAKLILLDREREGLMRLSKELGSDALLHDGDIANDATMDNVVRLGLERFGRIDGAFLNAGIEGLISPIESQPVEQFDRVMQVNVRAVFLGLAALMPLMKEQNSGSIVITSSTAGLRGLWGLSPYVTSKHALVGLMRTAALEGAAHNVRVNTIHPGAIDTRMIQSLELGISPDDIIRGREALKASIPAGRYGEPDDVAALVEFLLGSDASFCNGGIYQVDGGSLAGPRSQR